MQIVSGARAPGVGSLDLPGEPSGDGFAMLVDLPQSASPVRDGPDQGADAQADGETFWAVIAAATGLVLPPDATKLSGVAATRSGLDTAPDPPGSTIPVAEGPAMVSAPPMGAEPAQGEASKSGDPDRQFLAEAVGLASVPDASLNPASGTVTALAHAGSILRGNDGNGTDAPKVGCFVPDLSPDETSKMPDVDGSQRPSPLASATSATISAALDPPLAKERQTEGIVAPLPGPGEQVPARLHLALADKSRGEGAGVPLQATPSVGLDPRLPTPSAVPHAPGVEAVRPESGAGIRSATLTAQTGQDNPLECALASVAAVAGALQLTIKTKDHASAARMQAPVAGSMIEAGSVILAVGIPDSPAAPWESEIYADLRPVATEAERAWRGLLAAEAGCTQAREVTTPVVDAFRHVRADGAPMLFGFDATRVAAPAVQGSGTEVLSLQQELDPATSAWSPAVQPTFPGSLAVAVLPTTAAQYLEAAIVTALHRQASVATEIALSPVDLGGVRLRLEADARDPERMIVLLVFDRPETMDLFRRHAEQLSEAIRAAGYADVRLDFGQSGTGADSRGGGQTISTANLPLDPEERDQSRIQLPQDRPFTPRLAGIAGLDLRL